MAPRRSIANATAKPAADPAELSGEFPKAKYKKAGNADGYIAKRVESAEDEARLGPDWKDHPDAV